MKTLERNARNRSDGTWNFVQAIAAGARTLASQSSAWLYAPSAAPDAESNPLQTAVEGTAGTNGRAHGYATAYPYNRRALSAARRSSPNQGAARRDNEVVAIFDDFGGGEEFSEHEATT